jgi:hypothetical protein
MLGSSTLVLSVTIGAAGLDLRWTAPPSCPSATEVRDAIERLGPAADAGVGEFVVDATIRPIDAGFELELVVVVDGDRSERRLQAADCGDLARATALVAATMFDPLAIAHRVALLEQAELASAVAVPDPAPDPMLDPVLDPVPGPAPTAPSDDRGAPPRTDPRRRPRPAASLRVEGLAGVAALPRLDAGLSLAAGVALRRLRVEVGAIHLFAQTREHPRVPDVALRARATAAVVRACAVPRVGDWEFPVCGGGEVGVMSAQGQGAAVTDAVRVRRPWAAALVEAHAAWRVTPRFAVWIGVQGLVALARPRFTVAALEPFVRTPAGGGRAKLGVEVRFP